MYYCVEYTGDFGFIKPYFARRATEIRTSFYLPQSSIVGIEQNLFDSLKDIDYFLPKKIKRYRIDFTNLCEMDETTNSINKKEFTTRDENGEKIYDSFFQKNIVKRITMINPILYLLFDNKDDAEHALTRHVCLSRNEDILLGNKMYEIDIEKFNKINGYELLFSNHTDEDLVYYGIHKLTKEKQFGVEKIFATPTHLLDEFEQ